MKIIVWNLYWNQIINFKINTIIWNISILNFTKFKNYFFIIKLSIVIF